MEDYELLFDLAKKHSNRRVVTPYDTGGCYVFFINLPKYYEDNYLKLIPESYPIITGWVRWIKAETLSHYWFIFCNNKWVDLSLDQVNVLRDYENSNSK